MIKIVVYILIVFWASLVFAEITIAQNTGIIAGTVVDESGDPLLGAKVNVEPLNGRPQGSLLRYVETDAKGHFVIDRLAWGKYGAFAMKEDADYPDRQASFYSDNAFPIITISPQNPTAEVRIEVGPKAGLIVGSVINAANGAPVLANFKLTRAAARNEWLSTSKPSDYRVLLPSSTDVLLEVSAPGFNKWTPGHALRLEPGSEMHLDVLLEPSHDPNIHPSRFLVPEGYVGWLLLEYGAKDAPAISPEDGIKVFRFPENGRLETSSSGPEKGADDEYMFYSRHGSTQPVPRDYRHGRGMVWGQYDGSKDGVMRLFGFFVGSKEEYKKQVLNKPH